MDEGFNYFLGHAIWKETQDLKHQNKGGRYGFSMSGGEIWFDMLGMAKLVVNSVFKLAVFDGFLGLVINVFFATAFCVYFSFVEVDDFEEDKEEDEELSAVLITFSIL